MCLEESIQKMVYLFFKMKIWQVGDVIQKTTIVSQLKVQPDKVWKVFLDLAQNKKCIPNVLLEICENNNDNVCMCIPQCLVNVRFLAYDSSIWNQKPVGKVKQPKKLSFRGDRFTNVLLPILLSETPIKIPKEYPKWIHDVCSDSGKTPWAKIQRCLQFIYNPQNAMQSFSLWIAPTQQDNEYIGLVERVTLTQANSIGVANGNYFAWGFNGGFVSKWNDMYRGDWVVFGNAETDYMKLGVVEEKFIWLDKKADDVFTYPSPSGRGWVFGFTLRIVHRALNIRSFEQQLLSGGDVYQTQTKIREQDKKQRWMNRLEQILDR